MSKRIVILLTIILGLFLFSCPLPQGHIIPTKNSGNSIEIRITETTSRMLVPDINMNPAYYVIEGNGPLGEVFSTTTTPTTVTISNVATGEWNITITAFNASDVAIGVGTGTTTVSDNASSTLSVTVSPFNGFGTLELTVNWTAAQVVQPQIEAKLTPLAGASRNLNFTMATGTASFNALDIPTGYYTLSLKLLDNGILNMGAVEIVRIAKSATTSGTYTFDKINQAYGSIDVNITPNMENPLNINIQGSISTKVENETVNLNSEVVGYSENVTNYWYINGLLKSTSANFIFDNTWAPGNYRIDLLIISADGTRAASKSISIEVTPFIPIISIASDHIMIIDGDDSLWALGKNNKGQLADNTTTGRTTPIQVMTDVRSVAAGGGYTLIIKNNGSLWGVGTNTYGELADGTTIDRTTPVEIMTGVTAASTGLWSYSMILKDDGSLWSTGYERDIATGNKTATFTQIASNVKSFAAGNGHIMIIKNDDSLWATGKNSAGQLGDGTTTDKTAPVHIMNDVSLVSATGEHTMIVKNDGTLWATGQNTYGQLGDGTTTKQSTPVQIMTNVSSVSAGLNHTMILKTNGSLWATGYNSCGQLMNENATSTATPIEVMTDIKSVSTCNNYTMIVKDDGSIWAAGENTYEHGAAYIGYITPVKIMD